MTISDASGDDSRYRPWFRFVRRHTRWCTPFAMRLGHHALWLTVPFMALVLATDLSGRPGWLTWVTAGAQLAWFGAILTDAGYHAARLCERCMGATPLEPQAAVERWKPALRLEHRSGVLIAVLAVNVAWTLAAGHLIVDGTRSLGLPPHHVIWAYLLQDVPSVIVVSGYFIMDRIHRDLYPWCPWCRWGKGGPEELVPDPEPDPAVSR